MIRYVKGDATRPQSSGTCFIAHICNDQGAWGAGFVLALSKLNRTPELRYRMWHRCKRIRSSLFTPFELGEIQKVRFSPVGTNHQIYVVNMIAQHGCSGEWVGGIHQNIWLPPIRYAALSKCLLKLRDMALLHNASVHMPRIGCGLAGGSWDKVEVLVDHFLVQYGVPVTVYDL